MKRLISRTKDIGWLEGKTRAINELAEVYKSMDDPVKMKHQLKMALKLVQKTESKGQ